MKMPYLNTHFVYEDVQPTQHLQYLKSVECVIYEMLYIVCSRLYIA